MNIFKTMFGKEIIEEIEDDDDREDEKKDMYADLKKTTYTDEEISNDYGYSNYSEPERIVSHLKADKMELNMYSNSETSVLDISPQNVDDARLVVDGLISNKVVVMTIKDLDPEVAKKILNFCLGGCYAVKGNAKSSSKGTYIFSPAHITIDAANKDENYDNAPSSWDRQ